MTSTDNSTINLIKFKSTNTTHDLIQLEFQQNKTVQEYKQQIGELLDYDFLNIKFVFKGKVLSDKEKAGALGLKNNVVMMVLNKPKKTQKPVLSSAQQTIPKTNLNTGLGSSSPVGFGGYGIMNHPQYMSAISSAVDQQKVQEMMNDPFYETMMEQMLEDPDTLKQLMEENPMTKQMMEQNPMMKMVMSNPAMMKMVFNKQTIKMAKQMQKNGQISPQTLQNAANNGTNPLGGGLAGMGGFGGMGGMNGFGGIGGFGGLGGFGLPNMNTSPNVTSAQNTSGTAASNPLGNGNMMGNPFFPMMGSGFGTNQGMSFPNTQPNPFLFSNPLLGNINPSQNNESASSPSSTQNNTQNNGFASLFQNLQNIQQKAVDETKYSTQIKELNSMGFSDKDKCIKFLKESEGDIDKALEKLCLDDDQTQQAKTEKKQ